ncbi:amidohydrolase family protein [Paenochrobactrum glaciei]|uniref:Amidohydrolase family protein n=1 Tax=Paenochrobactrum glaciei TaxID=486407 RepID=A0ABN1GL10_9HYPH
MGTLLKNIRPWGGDTVDMLIRNGIIEATNPDKIDDSITIEDGGNAIAIPGLIDAHTHLDKTTWGLPWHENNRRAVLRDRIDFEREHRLDVGIDPHIQSMRHAIGLASNGATHIRSHVDIDTTHGLSIVEGVMQTREKLRDIIDIEIVAFPQSGLMVMPGTKELLDEALKLGCEVLGGIDPCGIDRDPKGQLDILFELAIKHQKPLDIHLHEAGELGAFTMELIFERIRTNGMKGQVAISHAFTLGSVDPARAAYLIEQLAELDVAILTTGAPSATVPAIMRLLDAGIRVGAGCDGIRDTWGPWGQPDMLDRARIIGMRNGLRSDHELEHLLRVVSQGGADVMQLANYGLEVGCKADLTLVSGETLAHAVVDVAPRPLVMKSGHITARNGQALIEMP